MYKKNKIFYWILNLTWGLIGTLIGLITALICWICGFKIMSYNGHILILIPKMKNASFSIGPCVFLGYRCDDLYPHEFGHTLQNCIYGPFMLCIYLASVIRFWYREIIYKMDKAKYTALPKYEDIWFEGQATKWGRKQLGIKNEQ